MMVDDGHDKDDVDDDQDLYHGKNSDPYQNGLYSLHCYNLLKKSGYFPKTYRLFLLFFNLSRFL